MISPPFLPLYIFIAHPKFLEVLDKRKQPVIGSGCFKYIYTDLKGF
jgi:hypothetical protein